MALMMQHQWLLLISNCYLPTQVYTRVAAYTQIVSSLTRTYFPEWTPLEGPGPFNDSMKYVWNIAPLLHSQWVTYTGSAMAIDIAGFA